MKQIKDTRVHPDNGAPEEILAKETQKSEDPAILIYQEELICNREPRIS